MSIALTTFVLWFSAVDLPVGTELNHIGTLSQQTKNGATEVKSFTLHSSVQATPDASTQLAFYIEERGSSLGWPERFGLVTGLDDGKIKSRPIRVLLTHEEQQYPITVLSPVVDFRDKLTPQSRWSNGRLDYTVVRQRKFMDRDCTLVEATSNLGRNQTLLIETATGILMSLEEKVIVGRGDEYQLKLVLQSQERLEADVAEKSQHVFQSLLAIQAGLNRTGDQKTVELTADQLTGLKEALPKLEAEAAGTPWTRLITMIGLDLQHQKKRIDGVAGLKGKLVGHPAPDWSLKLTNGTTVSDTDLKGKVVVLHFWQYRNEPLTEPYGQIGYLDFLAGKRKKLGVNVIGVNVDERFANPQQVAAATRSMKGLLDFMRISYDMATDDGSVLAEFGDPRALGTPLPLWIVIGHDGLIAHLHTGFYGIKPDEGLKQLDDAVIEAVRRQNAK